MINILKEAWSLYVSKFRVILKIMLPVVLLGIFATAYLEVTLGLEYGTFIIPSEISVILPLFFVSLLLLTVLIVSQLALAEVLKNEWKPFNLLKTVKFLVKLFWFRHFFLFFLIFLASNAPMGMFLKPQIENILLKQAMFNIVDFLLLLPLFHLYGYCLYKSNQLQSSAKNS